jgi:hypothetical protein
MAACPVTHDEQRHTGGLSEAAGMDGRLHMIHRVGNGERGGDDTTVRIDMKMNWILGIHGLEIEELGDDVGRIVVDGSIEHDGAEKTLRRVPVVPARRFCELGRPAPAQPDECHHHGRRQTEQSRQLCHVNIDADAGKRASAVVVSAAMKLLFAVSAGVVIGTVVMGCDAVKAREPKQASDPVAQPQKYGDTKLTPMDPGGDDGGAK